MVVVGTSKRLSELVRFLIICKSAYSLTRQHSDLEVLVSWWSIETHIFVTAWGEFNFSIVYVLQMIYLPLFDELNAMGTEWMTTKQK